MNKEQNILEIAIENIIPNRFQPRLNFEDSALEELAASIRQHGIIQPLVVRPLGDKYEIIAGERRYKAATLAGLKTVPVIISNMTDNESAEVAIVENVQRRDLTAIEEARSYKNLLDKGYLTQAELAKKMGLSQSAIANKLRLLNLVEEVQQALLKGQISERHARSLLALPNEKEQVKFLHKILEERLTVRQLDDAIKEFLKESDDSDTDIPLIRSLDIDAIKNEATELPKIDGGNDIAKKLKEIEREKMFNPEVVLVDQATNESKNNFFNFLENEKVNMNMEEINIEMPKINIAKENEMEKNEEKKESDVIEPKTNEQLAMEFNANFGNITNLQKEERNDMKEEIFDPIDLIDTLEPDYEEKLNVIEGTDLKTAINTIREANDSLKSKGFSIIVEETDLNDSYEINIKIKKN